MWVVAVGARVFEWLLLVLIRAHGVRLDRQMLHDSLLLVERHLSGDTWRGVVRLMRRQVDMALWKREDVSANARRTGGMTLGPSTRQPAYANLLLSGAKFA